MFGSIVCRAVPISLTCWKVGVGGVGGGIGPNFGEHEKLVRLNSWEYNRMFPASYSGSNTGVNTIFCGAKLVILHVHHMPCTWMYNLWNWRNIITTVQSHSKKNCSLFCFWCLYLCSWKFCLSHPKYVGHIKWRPHRVEATSSGGHIEWRPHRVDATLSGRHIEWTPWNMVATIFQTCSGGLNCVRFRKVPQFERLGNTVTQFCFAVGCQQETNSCALVVD